MSRERLEVEGHLVTPVSVARRAIVRIAFALMLAQPVHAQGTGKDFAPLANVIVVVQDSGVDRLLTELRAYAIDNNADMQNFPKSGQRDVNFGISFSENTFFMVQNFSGRNRFGLAMYSHEPREVWMPKWNLLIDRLIVLFGEQSVKVTKNPA